MSLPLSGKQTRNLPGRAQREGGAQIKDTENVELDAHPPDGEETEVQMGGDWSRGVGFMGSLRLELLELECAEPLVVHLHHHHCHLYRHRHHHHPHSPFIASTNSIGHSGRGPVLSSSGGSGVCTRRLRDTGGTPTPHCPAGQAPFSLSRAACMSSMRGPGTCGQEAGVAASLGHVGGA